MGYRPFSSQCPTNGPMHTYREREKKTHVCSSSLLMEILMELDSVTRNTIDKFRAVPKAQEYERSADLTVRHAHKRRICYPSLQFVTEFPQILSLRPLGTQSCQISVSKSNLTRFLKHKIPLADFFFEFFPHSVCLCLGFLGRNLSFHLCSKVHSWHLPISLNDHFGLF